MKKKLITSALPYVNNIPHLGNIIGSVLSADVYARFCRLRGYDTLYICGTDEYGTATESKAKEDNTTPEAICNFYHKIHKKVYKDFKISFDYFGRTSDKIHSQVTQEIFNKLDNNGYICQKESNQLYCNNDKMFLADRYVEGTCPHCKYKNARGDQCDNCSKLLNPQELIDPRCKLCRSTPKERLTKHLYLDLSKLSSKIERFINKSSKTGGWPENAIKTTYSWIENGLQMRPITRDLTWGVKVNKDGFTNKVFYVWFDAVMGYISITKKHLGDTWKDWWLQPDDVQLYQFMAKDNIAFHTIIFPAMLLGSKSNWTMLHHISSCEYLNFESQKFSKSRNIGVFGTDLKNIDLNIDWWRFYLLANRPETADTNFNWHDFSQDINSNFIDNIGNLLNRSLTLAKKIKLPNFDLKQSDAIDYINEFEKKRTQIINDLENVKIKGAINSILDLGRFGNKYLQIKTPWNLIKIDEKAASVTIAAIIISLREIAVLLQPYMPEFASKILDQLNFKKPKIIDKVEWRLNDNHQFNSQKILFKKLEKNFIDQLSITYGSEDKELIDNYKKLNIVAAKILEVYDHNNNDKLVIIICQIDKSKKILIVSALKKVYPVQELVGSNCLVITNLQIKNFNGINSEGLLLTAKKKDQLEPIRVSAPVGSKLIIEYETSITDNSLSITTIETLVKARLRINNGKLTIGNRRLIIDGHLVKSKVLLNAKVT